MKTLIATTLALAFVAGFIGDGIVAAVAAAPAPVYRGASPPDWIGGIAELIFVVLVWVGVVKATVQLARAKRRSVWYWGLFAVFTFGVATAALGFTKPRGSTPS